ncbi:MAG: hypothetical protein R3Y47_05830 [Lachnospiraceae bacterium]
MHKNDSDLFFCCSLIEFIARTCKRKRVEIADVYINTFQIEQGDFDNVKDCNYEVPDYWTIGEVYERFIEDIDEEDIPKTLIKAYHSFISDSISNYNSDFFYQPRDYIYQCYLSNEIL